METLADKPAVVIEYHTPSTDKRGPAASEVIEGLSFILLGSMSFSTGALICWIAISIFPAPLTVGSLVVACFCFLGSLAVFREAVRSFRGREWSRSA